MAGSLRAAALANGFRIPLGALMLIACVPRSPLLLNCNILHRYDQILSTGNDRRAHKAE
jgi:hypothetical protein